MEQAHDPFSALMSDDGTPAPEWDRLTKYLLGELDATDLANVERWVASDPIRTSVVELLKANWQSRPAGTPVDSVAALRNVLQRSGIHSGRRLPQQDSQIATTPVAARARARVAADRRSLGWKLWGAVGAMAACIAVVLVGVHKDGALWRRHTQGIVSSYATGNGERATITLPDGNTVLLGVASHLDVPADYVNGNRALRLSGEALFNVEHHASNPLSVAAGTTVARVLGTSFVVRHYASDSATTVAVHDGKVMVQAVAMRPVILPASRSVVVSAAGERLAQADPSQFSFATGRLTLKGMPLPQAIVELDRWYDVDIRLGDPSLRTQHLTGDYAAGSAAELANILELTFDVRVVRAGRVLTLVPR